MSVIVNVGHRSTHGTIWHRFRKECIYDGMDPKSIDDESFVSKRDKALDKIGAKWVDMRPDGMFRFEFENVEDATFFIMRWS